MKVIAVLNFIGIFLITSLTLGILSFYNPDVMAKSFPQCKNITGGIIWGQDINNNIITNRFTSNLSTLINDFCDISSLPNSYMVCGKAFYSTPNNQLGDINMFYIAGSTFVLLEIFALLMGIIIINEAFNGLT